MDAIRGIFEAVDAFPTSIAIRESIYGYPALLTSHIISMCFFAGLILTMDLRLAGIGNMDTPFSEVQRRLFPWQMLGMVMAFGTGMTLFYGQPMRFYGNVFFWLKMSLMALAGLNALIFHQIGYLTVDRWDTSRTTPLAAKLSGVLSIFLWAGAILSGRMIAYNWFQ